MKKQNPEKKGKLLLYECVSVSSQKLLDESRLKEWDNYLQFGAVKVISRAEAEKLVDCT